VKWIDEKEQFILPLKTLPATEEEAKKKLKEYQVKVEKMKTISPEISIRNLKY